jgi:predicted PurR-regulated permease PerM
LVAIFEVRGIRRERAVLFVYLLLVCLMVFTIYVGVSAIVQSASNWSTQMPLYVRQVKQFVDVNLAALGQIPAIAPLAALLQEQIALESQGWALAVVEQVPSLVRLHLLPLLEMSLLVPFLAYFFMMDGPRFFELVLHKVPARHVEMTLNILLEIGYSFGNYLRGILIQAFFMGVLAGIGYSVIGLNFAPHIAIWVALTSMVPFLGPISAALAGGLVAIFQWGTLTGLLKVVAIYGVIRFLDDWFLHPLILRRAIHIHPVLVVFTLMAGAYLGGLWGLLFAVPAACMVKVLLEVGWQWYQTEYQIRPSAKSTYANIPLV